MEHARTLFYGEIAMAVNDIYQLTLVTIVNGQRTINVQHFRETTACTDDIPARSLCAMWEDIMLPLWQDMMSEEAELTCIYARRIKPTLHIPFQVVETAASGSIVSHAAPSNAAAILTMYSATIGRSGRGRQFLSGMPESRISGGILEPTQITAISDYASALMVENAAPAPHDGEWKCCIFSPFLDDSNDMIEFVVNPSMGSIESRRQPYGMTS